MSSNAGILVGELMNKQKAKGPATILAIGTATPLNSIAQADYPDYYFRVTNSQHQTQLKDKFKRICDKTMIKTRYFHLTEEILAENPNLLTNKGPSLDTRRDMLITEVSKLGAEAATKAINEWGHSVSKITHLIFSSATSFVMPSADYQLTRLLGLNLDVKRYTINFQGCSAGVSALRLAKDLAENNVGARVLLVCSESTTCTFREPHLDTIIIEALFGDGASAVVIGSDPDPETERPLFQIVSTTVTLLPDSGDAITGILGETGFVCHIEPSNPKLLANNIEKVIKEAFGPIGISDWNSLFWVAHPGGPAILNEIETKLGLKEEKMLASREVSSQYGNMVGACVLFVLDEMRKKSVKDGKTTTGDGLDWGILIAFGPGITFETIVLHSMPI